MVRDGESCFFIFGLLMGRDAWFDLVYSLYKYEVGR